MLLTQKVKKKQVSISDYNLLYPLNFRKKKFKRTIVVRSKKTGAVIKRRVEWFEKKEPELINL